MLDIHAQGPLLHVALQAVVFALTQPLNKTQGRIADLLVFLSIAVLLLGQIHHPNLNLLLNLR